MAYLAEVQLPAASKNAADGSSTPAPEYGLTMRGHLANVVNGISGLPRMHGANLSYHILGAASAEIPMTQISTYLAAGFMRRFKETVGKDQLNLKLSKDTVSDWVDQIGLTAQQVYNDVTHGCPDLMLPDISIGVMPPKGGGAAPWDTAARNWCSRCEGQRLRNRAALEGELPKSLLDEDATDDSLIGKTFRKLCDIAKNPELGPYYAAFLLSRNGDDLKAAVEGAIQEIQGRKRDEQSYLDSAADRVVQASTNFCANRFFGIGDKRAYNDYVDSVKEYCRTYNRVRECTDVENTLRRFREQLENLNSGYFALLTEVLDNLLETFEEDEQWLDSFYAMPVFRGFEADPPQTIQVWSMMAVPGGIVHLYYTPGREAVCFIPLRYSAALQRNGLQTVLQVTLSDQFIGSYTDGALMYRVGESDPIPLPGGWLNRKIPLRVSDGEEVRVLPAPGFENSFFREGV